MLRADVITIFPNLPDSVLAHGMLRRAQDCGALAVRAVDLRAFTQDRHRSTDDAPFGGSQGMVMRPEPLFRAVESITAAAPAARVILTSPRGSVYNHRWAEVLAREPHLVFLCARYEGVDERVCQHLATDQLSIGDYVLSGGELAALVILDSVARLLPGVLGDEESAAQDSFVEGLLEYPQYTRPAEFRGWRVPDVLLSGHHEQIRRWRRGEALRITQACRPDLLACAPLTEEDRRLPAEQAPSEPGEP